MGILTSDRHGRRPSLNMRHAALPISHIRAKNAPGTEETRECDFRQGRWVSVIEILEIL